LFLRRLSAGVKASIRSKLQSADARTIFEEWRNFAVRHDFVERVLAQVGKVEVSLCIAARCISETIARSNLFPLFAFDQHFRKRFVSREVLGVKKRREKQDRKKDRQFREQRRAAGLQPAVPIVSKPPVANSQHVY